MYHSNRFNGRSPRSYGEHKGWFGEIVATIMDVVAGDKTTEENRDWPHLVTGMWRNKKSVAHVTTLFSYRNINIWLNLKKTS